MLKKKPKMEGWTADIIIGWPIAKTVIFGVSCTAHGRRGSSYGQSQKNISAKCGTQQIGETEAIKPILDFDGKDVWRCGNCGGTIFHPSNTQADEDEKNYNKYCRKCGQEVKWNDESGSN